MKLRMFLAAFFKLRNITVLVAAFTLALTLGQLFLPNLYMDATVVSLLVYAAFTIQTVYSKKFHEEFNRNEKVRLIRGLNYSCSKLASEAKKHTNSAYNQRLRKVMQDKNDIMNSFLRGEHSYLKEKIVEQTLNLMYSYLKLLTNFCIRSKELSGTDISVIANRINMNTRKLSFAKDSGAAEDIRKVVEMDEKMVNRLKNEKNELERMSAKLDYMESTVNMFKHQILSSVESEEMLEKLETVVNEASALDNVLEDRRKNRIRM